MFSNRALPKEKSDSKAQRHSIETIPLSTVKEDDRDASHSKTNNDDSSDEDNQENADDNIEDSAKMDGTREKKAKRENKRNVPKATSTTFDTDSEEISKATKSGGRVRSIHNDLALQGRSKRMTTKETARPITIPLTSQMNSSNGIRKSTFPPLIENSSSPYASKQSMPDPVKLRMSHGASTPAAGRSKSRGREQEGVANRGS